MILDKKNNIVLKQGIPDLSNYKLSKIVRRENTPLFNSFLRIGSTLRNKEFEFDNRMQVHIVLDNDVYSDEDDFKNLKKIMTDKSKEDITFLDRYFKKALKEPKDMIEWAKNNKYSDLSKTYNEFVEKALNIMTYLWPPLGPEEWILAEIEKRLTKYIDPTKDFEKFQKILTILTSSTEYSKINLRKQAMLEGKNLELVHKKYAWMKDHVFNLKYETFEEFKEELKYIKEPKKELKIMQKNLEELKINQKNIIKKYNLDKELLEFFNYAQILPHIRFARIECLTEAAYHLKDFFNKLKEKLNFDITLAYYWEITDFLEGKKINLEEIEKRKKTHSFILIDKDFYIFDEETSKKIKDEIESKLDTEGEIKGQAACLGKAKGPAKVLHSAKEISRVEKGDILVTSMTTPDYVPAMEKAAAFITDEGGLSCHAAIVAREMNKPCIISTKIATKVLKDGDLVEVDAEKGTVKKLN